MLVRVLRPAGAVVPTENSVCRWWWSLGR